MDKIKIILYKRTDRVVVDYIAKAENKPGFGIGDTPSQAIGDLVSRQSEDFNIEIDLSKITPEYVQS